MRMLGRLMAAAAGAVVVVGGSAASAAAAVHDPVPIGPAQVMAISHGCPGGNVCLYDSKSAFKKDKPTVIDTEVPGLHSGGVAHNVVVVNNSIKYYASQGGFEERMFKGGYLCEYVPDSKDEQSPNRIEDPADGASVSAIASGGKYVDEPFPVSLSYCT